MFASEEIGARIAQAREEAGLTQEDLGDLIDLSTRQLQNLEAGASKPFKHLEAIAGATGKPTEWFLHEDASESSRLEEALVELSALRAQSDEILELLRQLQEPPARRRAKP